MEFQIAYDTDTGLVKKTNQDSLCVMEAETEKGNILFALLCDGMGGLAKGEVASATLVRVFSEWFQGKLQNLLALENPLEEIQYQWDRMIKIESQNIAEYGRKCELQLGTTLTALLILENGTYLIGHVGDTRVYAIHQEGVEILTEDQTVVANEIRQGRLTMEQAQTDPRRSVLLQCIGASRIVEPVFLKGEVRPGECYMLCSDGFRHEISEEEILKELGFSANPDEAAMKASVRRLIKRDMDRGERDNISAILIKIV